MWAVSKDAPRAAALVTQRVEMWAALKADWRAGSTVDSKAASTDKLTAEMKASKLAELRGDQKADALVTQKVAHWAASMADWRAR